MSTDYTDSISFDGFLSPSPTPEIALSVGSVYIREIRGKAFGFAVAFILEPRARQIGQGCNQLWRIVERLWSRDFQSYLPPQLMKCDVDVVKHLYVVANEPYRLNDHLRAAFVFQTAKRFLHGRTKPRPTGHSLTLKCEGPLRVGQRELACNQRGCLASLLFVGIAGRDGVAGNAVGGENDGRIPACGVKRAVQLFCEGFNQQ